MSERERRLWEALAFAIEELEDALPYVPDYFREKWEYDKAVTELKEVLKETAA